MKLDERIPFTCQVTNKDCGSQIQSLNVDIDSDIILSIPLSDEITSKLTRKNINKIKKAILNEIKNLG